MKTILNLSLALLLFSSILIRVAIAQTNPPVKQWEINMPTTLSGAQKSEFWFYKIIQTSDGGYLGGGYAILNDYVSHVPSIVKYDAEGNFIWEDELEADDYYGKNVADLLETDDGYIVLTSTNSSINTFKAIALFIVDKNTGEFDQNEDVRIYTLPANLADDYFDGIGPANIQKVGVDDGFILAGTVNRQDNNAFVGGAILIRLDNSYEIDDTWGTDGYNIYGYTGTDDVLWKGSYNSNASRVKVIYNSGEPIGFMLTGAYKYIKLVNGNSASWNLVDALVVYIDIDGVQQWQKNFNEGNILTYDEGFTGAPFCTTTPCGNLIYSSGINETDWETALDVFQVSETTVVVVCKFDNFGWCLCYPVDEFELYREADIVMLNIDIDDGDVNSNNFVSHFAGSDFDTPCVPVSENGFSISGFAIAGDDIDGSGIRFKLAITDVDGALQYEKVYDNPPFDSYNDCVFGMASTTDGGLILAGNNNEDGENYAVLKLSSDCQVNETFTDTYDKGKGTYTLSANETWNHDARIAGQIIVPSGKTLTIEDCTIQFADSRQLYDYIDLAAIDENLVGIVVKKGGTLNISDATLKGLNACEREWMWDGIKVEGDPTLSQTTYSNQGHMIIDGTSIIENARIGTVAGKTKFETGYTAYASGGNLYKTDFNYSSANKGGAVITGTGTTSNKPTWLNCLHDIVFSKYDSQTSTTNQSSFTNCNFTCDDYLTDPNYLKSEDNSFVLDQRTGTDYFIGINDAHGITFTSCNWNGFTTLPTGTTFRGTGILSLDGDFVITRNCLTGSNNCCDTWDASSFNNLSYGIDASATSGSSLLFPITIDLNDFNNCYRSVLINGVHQPFQITRNTFNIPSSPNKAFGTELEGCTGWTEVEGNTFSGASASNNYGLIVSNSGGANNKIYRNGFDHLDFPNVAAQVNASSNGNNGLQLLCGVFSYTNYEIIISSELIDDPSDIHAGKIRNNQGVCSNNTSPASNVFNGSCSGTENIHTDANYSGNTINYRYFNAGANYNPGCVSSYVSETVCTGNVGYSTACPPSTNLQCGTGDYRLASDSSMLVELDEEWQLLLQQQMDGDTSSALQDQISDIEAQRTFLINKMLADDMRGGNISGAITWLSAENEMKLAIPLMIAIGDYTAALTALENFPADSIEDLQFVQLESLIANLGIDSLTIFDLDSAQTELIAAIASTRTSTSYQARNILAAISGYRYADDIPVVPETDQVKYKSISISSNGIMKVYPIPANKSVRVVYSCNGIEKTTLQITNYLGKVIHSIVLDCDAGIIDLDVSDFSAGSYLIRMSDGNSVYSVSKIVIMK